MEERATWRRMFDAWNDQMGPRLEHVVRTDGFADQARHELAATGETARRRSVDTLLELTAQEAHIARLAAEGRTNPEIAAQLYVSPRTVEHHVSSVLRKRGMRSRTELAGAFGDGGGSRAR